MKRLVIFFLFISASSLQAQWPQWGGGSGNSLTIADTVAGSSKFGSGNGVATISDVSALGSGDITAVGDAISGAAFTGTSGTSLTFNNAGVVS